MDQNIMEQLRALKENQAAVKQLMSSPDGQKLMAMLTEDGGAKLRKATESAESGNTADVVHMIAEIMQTKEGSALVQRLSAKTKIK